MIAKFDHITPGNDTGWSIMIMWPEEEAPRPYWVGSVTVRGNSLYMLGPKCTW